jgi:hypothetical protein
MPRSPSPPVETIGRLWYELQDFDGRISYVSQHLQRDDPPHPVNSPAAQKFRKIREEREKLLRNLIEGRRDLILQAMETERMRHTITMQEMRVLLRAVPGASSSKS